MKFLALIRSTVTSTVITTFCFLSCQTQKNLKIIPVSNVKNIVTKPGNDSIVTGRFDYFILENTLDNSDSDLHKVAKYAQSYSANLKNQYPTYGMLFFKKSKTINLKSIANCPAGVRWKLFAHDIPIVEFRWIYGQKVQ